MTRLRTERVVIIGAGVSGVRAANSRFTASSCSRAFDAVASSPE